LNQNTSLPKLKQNEDSGELRLSRKNNISLPKLQSKGVMTQIEDAIETDNQSQHRREQSSASRERIKQFSMVYGKRQRKSSTEI
jgi:hypothetical protein